MIYDLDDRSSLTLFADITFWISQVSFLVATAGQSWNKAPVFMDLWNGPTLQLEIDVNR